MKTTFIFLFALLMAGCCGYQVVRVDPCFNIREAYGEMAVKYSDEILQNSILEIKIDSLENVIEQLKVHRPVWIPDSGSLYIPFQLRHQFLEQMRKDAESVKSQNSNPI